MTFIVQKKNSSDIIITQALYTCRYDLRVAVSSSCYCKLGDWNSNSLKFKMLKQKTRSDSYCMNVAELKKMNLQEHQEFTKCLKSKCSKDEFLNNAWPKKKSWSHQEPSSTSSLVHCTCKTGTIWIRPIFPSFKEAWSFYNVGINLAIQ